RVTEEVQVARSLGGRARGKVEQDDAACGHLIARVIEQLVPVRYDPVQDAADLRLGKTLLDRIYVVRNGDAVYGFVASRLYTRINPLKIGALRYAIQIVGGVEHLWLCVRQAPVREPAVSCSTGELESRFWERATGHGGCGRNLDEGVVGQ